MYSTAAIFGYKTSGISLTLLLALISSLIQVRCIWFRILMRFLLIVFSAIELRFGVYCRSYLSAKRY